MSGSRQQFALIVAAIVVVVAGIELRAAWELMPLAEAQDRLNCSDFNSQADAQQHLREDLSDPDKLDEEDGKDDGIACETFPYSNPDRNLAGGEGAIDNPGALAEAQAKTAPPSPPSPPPSPTPPPPQPPASPPPGSNPSSLMNAGGPETGPVPPMANGGCPQEFPIASRGACYLEERGKRQRTEKRAGQT